jgi:hypothetical protein
VRQEKSAYAAPGEITTINRPIKTGYDATRRQAISLGIQAKLVIGEANDRYEQEADRVAEQVMRQPEQDRQPDTGRLHDLLHSDQRISRSIRIRGDRNFEITVQNDLSLLTGSTAQNLLSTLRSSWSVVEINQVGRGCGTRMVNNVALLFYNPARCPISPRDDVWDGSSVPNAIYLAHELIHALRLIQDSSAATRPLREWRTVGLGRHASLPYSENRIRCEMGLPLRTFYYADDRQRYRLQGFGPPRCDNNTYSQPVLRRSLGDLIEPPSTPIQVGGGIVGPGETLQPKLEDNRSSWSPLPAISALSTHGIQRTVGDPRPIAVRYGPELMPFHNADIHGIIFDTDVICGGCTASIGNMHLFEEREQLSDSFGHQGSFRQVRGGAALPFSQQASDWQIVTNVQPDRHGLPESLIQEAANHGNGSFSIRQLDIYRRRGETTNRVIRYSGYRVIYSVVTDPADSSEDSIVLDVEKIPQACTVNGYRADPGASDATGTPSPAIRGRTYVQGGRVLRPGHSLILRSRAGTGPETPNFVHANPDIGLHAGQPLPASVRSFFEPRFGYDFSQVRIHQNRRAADTARRLNARAFTLGRDIVFADGEYVPGSYAGKKLIAHELTHVIQQNQASRPWVQRYRFDAYPAAGGAEFGGLGAYAERQEREGRSHATPVTDLTDLLDRMSAENQRRRTAGIEDNRINELHLYGHGLSGQVQIGGVNYSHEALSTIDGPGEALMQPGAIMYAESCLSAQGAAGWELFSQLGRIFFGRVQGWLQGNTEAMQTIAGPIEARPRLFRYPHDFRADVRTRATGDVEEALRFLAAEEAFLRHIDIDDSRLPRALIRGTRYTVQAVSDTGYSSGRQDIFVKFTLHPVQVTGGARQPGPFLHASGSAHWPYNETVGPSWTFNIDSNGEFMLTLQIWTTRRPGATMRDPATITPSERLTLRIIRRPLNVGYPRI